MSALKPSEVLAAAADLIAPRTAWFKGNLARSATGRVVSPIDPKATCWCMDGAIQRAAGGVGEAYRLAATFAKRTIAGRVIPAFNDDLGRTHSEAVSALRKAADQARAEGQ